MSMHFLTIHFNLLISNVFLGSNSFFLPKPAPAPTGNIEFTIEPKVPGTVTIKIFKYFYFLHADIPTKIKIKINIRNIVKNNTTVSNPS